MSAIHDLTNLCKAYGDAEDISLSAVSWRVFGDTKKLAALLAGADIQVRRFEAAMDWLSTNWPAKAQWPANVSRPPVHPAPPSEDAATMAPGAEAGAGKNGANVPRTEVGA